MTEPRRVPVLARGVMVGLALTIALSAIPNFFASVCTSWGAGWPLPSWGYRCECYTDGATYTGIFPLGAAADLVVWSVLGAAVVSWRSRRTGAA